MNELALGTGRPYPLSRRQFLISAAGTGFVLGFAPPAAATAAGTAQQTRLFEPTIWYDIDRDGLVTVNVIRAEMGQHVGTGLARIVADELEARWNDVRIRAVDSDPKWGIMVTGGSWSMWQSFPYLSQAGAAGRITLIEEGAKLLGVNAASCSARDSMVLGSGRSVSYAEIVRRGNLTRVYSAEELKAMPIKPASQRRLIGFTTPALDIPDKTTGAARYGLDAELPGMIFARPKLPPTRYGCRVVSIDDSAARSVPGYLESRALEDPSGTVPGWVVVCGQTFPAASLAADKVKVTWSGDGSLRVSEQDLQEHARKLIEDPGAGTLVVNNGDVDQAFGAAKQVFERSYTTSTVVHFQLEPVNALATYTNGRWEIHTGNQWQSLIVPVLAKALEVPETQVVLRTYLLGGGFGRRLNGDYTVPAALAAKALGKPVKLVLTREDDLCFDSPRSPSVQRLRIAFGDQNRVTAMQHDAAAGWPTQAIAPAFMGKGTDGKPYDVFAIVGADSWYSVGAQRVRAICNDLANRSFRPGYLRSVGPGWVQWGIESFMDEAAHNIGADPLAFRLSLLDGLSKNGRGGAAQLARVLKRAADKADWGSKLPPDTGLGIAATFGQERDMPTWIGCVARLHVDRSTGAVRLEKLTLVVDPGTCIDPDGALAQVEGAALWGVSMALHEGTEFKDGLVEVRNLDTYTPLRMRDVPELDIEFIPNTEPPRGLGEPATTVVGPAIGNAIFAAVGVRLRHIPITAQAILAALSSPT